MEENKINFRSIAKNILISFILTILAIFVIVILTKGEGFFGIFFEIKPFYLVLAFLMVGFSWILESVIILLSLKLVNKKILLREAINLAIIGNFFSAVTPFQTGGQPFQMYLLNKNFNVEYGKSALIFLIKEVVAFIVRISLFVAIPIFIAFFKFEFNLSKGVNLALNIGLLFYFLISILIILAIFKTKKLALLIEKIVMKIFPPKTSEKIIEEIEKNINMFEEGKKSINRKNIKDLFVIFILSLLQWLTSLFIPVILLKGLGSDSPILSIIFVTIIFLLSIVYVPTPGTSGAAEIGIAFLFSSFLPRQPLVTFILLWRFFYYYLTIIVGGIFLLKEFLKKRKIKKS
ncbi:MAG: lysylphosphatidylglycerol synthase transmembrane domain-containing protein [Caldisericia bacterium]|jgi:uncharacterized protein (TIRG00374 family)|nr:lysylphosphatidylglycerol synthase transmembrane domain-containing protein [Caldisericia bacterium]